jgi:hypothetical protein
VLTRAHVFSKIESADGSFRDSFNQRARVILKEENVDPPASADTIFRARLTDGRRNGARSLATLKQAASA